MLFLNTRSIPVGGGTCPVKIYDPNNSAANLSDLASFIQGRNVLLITHGFNVNQPDGTNALTNWAALLQLNNVAVVGMLWPGDARWIHAIDYPIEGNEAITAGNELATFINANFSSAVSLSFASHSLGARVVLQTISGLNLGVRRLLLMAGAIDNTCLTAEYATAATKVESISLLASHGDDVLKWAFPAGNFLSGIFTHGLPYVHTALGREGPASPYPNPNNIHANWQIPDAWSYGHGNYLPDATVTPDFPLTVDIPPGNPNAPPNNTPPALDTPNNTWQPAWSAAFESTRWP